MIFRKLLKSQPIHNQLRGACYGYPAIGDNVYLYRIGVVVVLSGCVCARARARVCALSEDDVDSLIGF